MPLVLGHVPRHIWHQGLTVGWGGSLHCLEWSVQCSLMGAGVGDVSSCSLLGRQHALRLRPGKRSELLGKFLCFSLRYSVTLGLSLWPNHGGKGSRCAGIVNSGHQQRRPSLSLHNRHQHKSHVEKPQLSPIYSKQ